MKPISYSDKSRAGRWSWSGIGKCALLSALACAAIAGQSPAAASAAPVRLFVSPDGQDSWAGTKRHPFRTLERARDAVRALTPSMTTDIVVNLRGGTYALEQPLQLQSAAGDGGEGGHRVVYQAYGFGTGAQEQPVISGGQRITGWQLVGGDVWSADVADLETRQLYVDGVRASRPTQGPLPGRVRTTATGYVTDSTEPQSWERPEDVEMVYRNAYGYAEARCGVADVTGDAIQTTVVMDQPCFDWASTIYTFNETEPSRPLPFIPPTSIENSPSFMEPGEWYLDRSESGQHKLLYRARSGESPARMEFVAPVLETLVSGEGTAADPLSDVAFRGLTFSHSTWLAPSEPTGFAQVYGNYYYDGGSPDQDPTNGDLLVVPSAVTFTQARNVLFARNQFAKLGAGGLAAPEGISGSVFKGNEFTDTSAGGIELSGVEGNDDGNRVANNWFHDVGVEYRGTIAATFWELADSVVAHNQIDDVPFNGIVFSSPGGGMRVRDNLVFDTNNVVYDGGGIYASGPLGSSFADGAVVRGNVVYDVRNPQATRFGAPIAMYPDNGADWLKIKQNVIYDSHHALGGVAPGRIQFKDNFWDDDFALWYVFDEEGVHIDPTPDSVQQAGNTLLPAASFAAACSANATCDAIVENAGLTPAFADLLE